MQQVVVVFVVIFVAIGFEEGGLKELSKNCTPDRGPMGGRKMYYFQLAITVNLLRSLSTVNPNA
jgi:hypothetical protein